MSTTTITFKFYVGTPGVLTDVTSAVLDDPTNAFGVRRTDNNAIVVAANTALTHQSTGIYTYSFTDPAPNLTYEYWVTYVYGGATYREQRYVKGSSSSPSDLTTLAEVKAYMHISNTDNDSLLSSLITQVSRRIETDCGRVFSAADYIEPHNIMRGQTRVMPYNKPIIQLYRVAWGNQPAIQVAYTGSAIAATMGITPDRRFIINTNSTSGRATALNVDLTNASYSACSQIVTAINAISGFSAQLYSSIDVPTAWLFPTSNLTLKSYNANFTQSLLFAANDIFGYEVDPVYNTIGFQPYSLADYVFDGRNMAGNLAFPTMYNGLILQYRGGYETIPQDIVLLANQVVADVYNQSTHDRTLSSESLGDYSYAIGDILRQREFYADILAAYSRPKLAGGMG